MSDKNALKSGIFDFISASPTAYHTVKNISERLIANGFVPLLESEKWTLTKGGKYFVTRNFSSIIAFVVGDSGAPFMICASHSDSPAFKVKEECVGAYNRLSVERYGSMIMYSWFDRPLSIAGRVLLKSEAGIVQKLFNIDRDLLVIPSVAIHLSNKVNDGFAPNPAVDLYPLFSLDKNETLRSYLSRELSVDEEKILSHETYLYAREKGAVIGADSDIILAPRLDNLGCVYASLEAFLSSKPTEACKVLAVFDNEEVGSSTKQGANSTFLSDTLERISESKEGYIRALSSSFMVSADNAHAKHPAHPELSDPANAPVLSGGIVIKHNANQRYTTDAVSEAVFSEICKRAGAKTQHYYNRADLPGGSTLGSIANTKVSVSSIDIGLPQLAMHSAVESAALSDVLEMISGLCGFYGSSISFEDSKIIIK